MKNEYLKHSKERKENNLPPLALDAKQTKSVVDNLISGSDDEFYLDSLTYEINLSSKSLKIPISRANYKRLRPVVENFYFNR